MLTIFTLEKLKAILIVAMLALAVFLVYRLFQRIIKPLVRWIFRIEAPAEETEDPKATDPEP